MLKQSDVTTQAQAFRPLGLDLSGLDACAPQTFGDITYVPWLEGDGGYHLVTMGNGELLGVFDPAVLSTLRRAKVHGHAVQFLSVDQSVAAVRPVFARTA